MFKVTCLILYLCNSSLDQWWNVEKQKVKQKTMALNDFDVTFSFIFDLYCLFVFNLFYLIYIFNYSIKLGLPLSTLCPGP